MRRSQFDDMTNSNMTPNFKIGEFEFWLATYVECCMKPFPLIEKEMCSNRIKFSSSMLKLGQQLIKTMF